MNVASKSAPTRVLHVMGRLEHGGAEMRTIDLIRHLDASRFRLDFCTLSGQPGCLDEVVRALGCVVHPCALGPGFGRRFQALLMRERYDVVHSHVHHSSGYILRLADQVGIRNRIAHFRSTHDGQGESIIRRGRRWLLKRWIDRHATGILAVSEHAMCEAWRSEWRRDQRCQVIYNGVDLRKFAEPVDSRGVRDELGLPDDCPICVHVGNMSPAKNHIWVLRVFRVVAQRHPSARLLLVGREEPESVSLLRRKIEEWGLGGRVVFAGTRNDVPRLLKASSMMVFPSVREGLPGAVLEACAAGIPVVASDILPVREIAAHFPAVQCVSLERTEEEWAKAVSAILEDDAGRAVLGSDGDATEAFRSSVFEIRRAVTQFEKVWTSCRTGNDTASTTSDGAEHSIAVQ